ncbi:hypothetical protein [Thiolapillus sp.]
MRITAVGVMMLGLVAPGLVLGEGGYPSAEGPGSINWPPPGGVYPGTSHGKPEWYSTTGQGLRPYPDYQQLQRYRKPSNHQFRQELIRPPGDDWPNADYYQGKKQEESARQPGQLRPEPMERGRPVEVVPPPSVPIDDVKAPISDKPEHGWRPMKEQKDLEAMEESVVPPEPKKENKTLKMREISRPVSPLHQPLEGTLRPPADGAAVPVSPSAVENREPMASGMSVAPPADDVATVRQSLPISAPAMKDQGILKK